MTQLDGESRRNVLLGRARAETEVANTDQSYADQPLAHAQGRFDQDTILSTLDSLALPLDTALSVLAVEVYCGAKQSIDPLGDDLGQLRILRTSPLTEVPEMCLTSTPI